MADSIITSVTQQTAFPRPHGESASDFLPPQITLNLRGRRFVVDRETLNHLPDSLLNTMFPNGMLHIGRGGYGSYGYGNNDYSYYRGDSDDDSEQTWVDFDPDMLEYVLRGYGEVLEYDLLAPASTSQQNGDEVQATTDTTAEQKSGPDNNDKSSSLSGQGQSSAIENRSENNHNKNGVSPSENDTEDTPAWLNYASDGKANLVVSSDGEKGNGNRSAKPASGESSSAAGAASNGGSAKGAAVPVGETNNDSISTFTDTGSHVNSSSGATQSTSSSAVLNYMRFVADVASHTNGNVQVKEEPHQSLDTGVVYYDRNPLVVLREELDYFVVPSSGRTKGDISDVPGFTLEMAKTRCGELLVEDDSVFEPLERTMQRNLEKWRSKISTEGASDEAQALQSASVIEQQLIDMLCLAGFPRDARWGCRRTEPSKTSVTSLLTVPLDESADQSRMIAAQKLLLFYKKPARKCWWEGEDVNAGDSEHKIDLKLWCRRTWTLELVLI